MRYLVKRGWYYAIPLQLIKKLRGIRCTNKRAMSAVVRFHSNCQYEIGKDQSDINKLFGFHSVYTTRTQFESARDGLTAIRNLKLG